MNSLKFNNYLIERTYKNISELLYLAGFRYWTASLLPALVGTTLPFWLRPTGFKFRWFAAIEFLLATVLFHIGFSFLNYFFTKKYQDNLSNLKLAVSGFTCIFMACLLGVQLNSELILHRGVPSFIFIVYGLATIFVGLLYVAPPFSFSRRIGGEIIIAEGLGMIPLLGAYLVQVGDITRTVYIASLSIVVSIGLWVWIEELISRLDDEKVGRKTLVIDFGPKVSGRYVVVLISILFLITILFAVVSSSISPLSLSIFLFTWLIWKIISLTWTNYRFPDQMIEIKKKTIVLHTALCLIITISSLVKL